MANPANLTINDVTSNSAVNQPAAQTIDTNGTVNCLSKSQTHRLMIELVNGAANAIDVTVKAGTSVAAHTARDLKVTCAATGGAGANKLIGPLESARFIKPDGSVDLQFQAATGSPNLAVRIYRLQQNG